MKAIKPLRLSFLHRTFDHDRKHHLVATVLVGFDLHDPKKLIPEVDLWKMIATTLGKFTVFDHCMWKPDSEILGPQALAQASIVFIPALALSRDGSRLGRGAGYYDRSLGASSAVRIGIVYDDEVLDELPVEATDVPMDWALTPEAGFRQFRP